MSDLHWAAVVMFCVLLAWFLYVTRPGGETDGGRVYSRLQRGWRRTVFWFGDLRFVKRFPFLIIGYHDPEVTPEEFLKVLTKVRPGDVGLATHAGYFFSNSAIPGLFKHAMIFSKGGASEDVRIIEAISEGVVERHPEWARSDFMIILRPKGTDEIDGHRAAATAKKMLGCDYDADFNFDMEAEASKLEKTKALLNPEEQRLAQEDAKELQVATQNIKAEFDHAFSCTEVVATSWWFKRHEMRIYRHEVRGRNCIVADQFVNRSMDIVWLSDTVTVEVANKYLGEEAAGMVADYWSNHERAKRTPSN